MGYSENEKNASCRIGDRSTSDVVVRLRTEGGRDEWMYCHSHVLIKEAKYFSDRLSDNWPTCQIIDSRNCVEVYCQESDFDHHVTFLRLLYSITDGSDSDIWHGVRNALGILRVAVELRCHLIITSCVNYLEAVPWEEAEEEEILQIIPSMGSEAQSILARLQPVNVKAIIGIFLSAVRFATSSPPPSMNDLKNSAQEQLEYMLTEDDDAPLLTADDEIKTEVRECVKRLLSRFNNLIDSLCEPNESVSESGRMQLYKSYVIDLSWVCQILIKLESMKEFVNSWLDLSEKMVKAVEIAIANHELLEIKLKLVEVTAKVLEAVGYGNVILPTAKRIHIVKVWLPFVRVTKPIIDSATKNGMDEDMVLKMDGELWQSLESAFVSIILALPSNDEAEILTEWLQSNDIQYPDLTEAFEVWCYRSKVAKRRLDLLDTAARD